ncbi:hypothetical protein NMY22_g8830 [Coprinellus aureogranulatus]|nr:hypothetical protein NMY22_g8830 [Coprinellus aureogranulatus]
MDLGVGRLDPMNDALNAKDQEMARLNQQLAQQARFIEELRQDRQRLQEDVEVLGRALEGNGAPEAPWQNLRRATPRASTSTSLVENSAVSRSSLNYPSASGVRAVSWTGNEAMGMRRLPIPPSDANGKRKQVDYSDMAPAKRLRGRVIPQPEPGSASAAQTSKSVPGKDSKAPIQPKSKKKKKSKKQKESIFNPPPNVMREAQVIIISDETKNSCLGNLQSLSISPYPITCPVTRPGIEAIYGAKPRWAYTLHIPEEKNPSGSKEKRLLFLHAQSNPYQPQTPGQHGLTIKLLDSTVVDGEPWSCFRSWRYSKHTHMYLGEYESRVVGKLTAADFSRQDQRAQRFMAERVLHAHNPKPMSMKARIALRKARRLPTSDEASEASLVEEEIERNKAGKGLPVDAEDILEALRSGAEHIDIVLHKCVGYDHTFAKDLARKYRVWQKEEDARQTKSKTGNAGSTVESHTPSEAAESSHSSRNRGGPMSLSLRDVWTNASPTDPGRGEDARSPIEISDDENDFTDYSEPDDP